MKKIGSKFVKLEVNKLSTCEEDKNLVSNKIHTLFCIIKINKHLRMIF